MVIFKHAALFAKDSTTKYLTIEYDATVITNEDLFNQEFTLEESLCSDSELHFGSCEASVIKFKVANIVAPMINKWITVKMYLEGHSDVFVIGTYKVAEDKPTADRQWRDITAYDALHDIINTDVAEWYNSVLPEKDDWITMRSFRTSFMQHFGIEQENIELVNDYMKVERTIEPESISGLDVITAICEINGCFGHIGRDGKFHYIYLPQAIQGLYPANDLFPDHAPDYLPYQQETGHLYPQDPKGIRIGADGTYIGQPQYSDFITKSIKKLQIRQEENDIGVIIGDTGDNCYIIEDNFLVYGKGSEELRQIGNNIFNKITNIIYRPVSSLECIGNPCVEVGDPIRVSTKYMLIESYILQRTLTGIQALRDNYEAQGVEIYAEQVNGVHKSIKQLKGKANILERTIEETRLEMTDIEAGLKNEISITAEGLQANITAEQKRAEGEEKKLSNEITITAEGLAAEIIKETERASGEEEKLSTSLSITAQGLQASIDEEISRATGEEEKLSNDIDITAEGLQANITAEQKRAEGEEEALRLQIKVTADEFSTKLSKQTEVWSSTEFEIHGSGSGLPSNVPSEYYGKYYVNIEDGKIYLGVQGSDTPAQWVEAAYYVSGNFMSTGNANIFELSNQYDYNYNLPSQFYRSDISTKPSGGYLPTDNDFAYKGAAVGTVYLYNYNLRDYGAYDKMPSDSTRYKVESLHYYICTAAAVGTVDHWEYAGQAKKSTMQDMTSQIVQTAEAIKTKVSKGEVSSEISQEAGQVKISAGRFIVESNYLDINKNGTSGEIVSKNGSGRYIKLNTGGLEGGYNNTARCKIVCNNQGLEFRGNKLTFCMDSIYVGTSMSSTNTKKAYTGDIAYVAPQDGDVTKLKAATLHVWNGLVLDNTEY